MSDLDDIRFLLRETAQIVSSNARAIQANSNAIADLRQTQERSFEQIDGLARETLQQIIHLHEAADQDRTLIREMQTNVREMQTDIQGLQRENRRILERLEQHINEGQ